MTVARAAGKSATTILALSLSLTAVLVSIVPVEGMQGISLTLGMLGALVAATTWSSPSWRERAGHGRRFLVSLAGFACILVTIRSITVLIA